MKAVLRWLGIALASLVVLVLVGAITVYFASERTLKHTYPFAVQTLTVPVPVEPDALREGQRLAKAYDCLGCHGQDAAGQVMLDDPALGRIPAPSLRDATHRYTPAQFAAIVRTGVRPDGIALQVMPSEAYRHLDDADLAKIIGYLASLPAESAKALPALQLGPVGRLGLVIGKLPVSAKLIAEGVPNAPPAASEQARGRYLALVACSHCHGPDLRGRETPEWTSTNLQVVRAYDLHAFTALLRNGVAVGNRAIGVMKDVAVMDLKELTDEEIAQLHAYLSAAAIGS